MTFGQYLNDFILFFFLFIYVYWRFIHFYILFLFYLSIVNLINVSLFLYTTYIIIHKKVFVIAIFNNFLQFTQNLRVFQRKMFLWVCVIYLLRLLDQLHIFFKKFPTNWYFNVVILSHFALHSLKHTSIWILALSSENCLGLIRRERGIYYCIITFKRLFMLFYCVTFALLVLKNS